MSCIYTFDCCPLKKMPICNNALHIWLANKCGYLMHKYKREVKIIKMILLRVDLPFEYNIIVPVDVIRNLYLHYNYNADLE